MYKLQRFCCCVSLRTGTLIIGLVYLIGSLISLGGLIAATVRFFRRGEINLSGYDKEHLTRIVADFHGIIIANKVISVTMLTLCGVQVVLDILLIVAAAKSKAKLALPWLVLNSVFVSFNLAGFAAVSIMGFIYIQPLINIASIGSLVVGLIYLGVSVYTMLVVCSFYEHLKKKF